VHEYVVVVVALAIQKYESSSARHRTVRTQNDMVWRWLVEAEVTAAAECL